MTILNTCPERLNTSLEFTVVFNFRSTVSLARISLRQFPRYVACRDAVQIFINSFLTAPLQIVTSVAVSISFTVTGGNKMGKCYVNVVHKIPIGVLCSQLMAFCILRFVVG